MKVLKLASSKSKYKVNNFSGGSILDCVVFPGQALEIEANWSSMSPVIHDHSGTQNVHEPIVNKWAA